MSFDDMILWQIRIAVVLVFAVGAAFGCGIVLLIQKAVG